MKQYVGKRVLVRVDGVEGSVHMSVIRALSPNGVYALLQDFMNSGADLGWRHVGNIHVLDVLGPEEDTLASLVASLRNDR